MGSRIQKVFSDKNNIPSSGSDAGAGSHGTVVFAIVTTVPCSGSTSPLEEFETLRGVLNQTERWNVVTTRYFETASQESLFQTTPNSELEESDAEDNLSNDDPISSLRSDDGISL